MTRDELAADRVAAIARYERAEAERDALVARIAQLERELAGGECPTCAGPMDRDGCIECRKSDVRHARCVEALKALCDAADERKATGAEPGLRHDPKCTVCAAVKRARAALAGEDSKCNTH